MVDPKGIEPSNLTDANRALSHRGKFCVHRTEIRWAYDLLFSDIHNKRRSMSYRTSGGNCTAIAINPGRAMTLSLTGRSKLPTSVYGRCAWNISYVATLKMPCPRYASVEIQPAASQESRSKPHSKRHRKNWTEGDKLSDLYCILQYKRV